MRPIGRITLTDDEASLLEAVRKGEMRIVDPRHTFLINSRQIGVWFVSDDKTTLGLLHRCPDNHVDEVYVMVAPNGVTSDSTCSRFGIGPGEGVLFDPRYTHERDTIVARALRGTPVAA